MTTRNDSVASLCFVSLAITALNDCEGRWADGRKVISEDQLFIPAGKPEVVNDIKTNFTGSLSKQN
jgi:hypothetical protein